MNHWQAGQRMNARLVNNTNTSGCYKIKPEGCSKQCYSMVDGRQALEHRAWAGGGGVCILLQNSRAGMCLNPELPNTQGTGKSWLAMTQDF